jgi:rifampicin phosphotransferase
MTSAEQTGANFVVDLRDLGDRDAGVVGTKAANLARLTALGLRVPEGFVITTAACDRILATAGHAGGARAGVGIPQDVWAAVRSHLDELGDGAVAVRSSGTAEDLSAASYAGQYETVLGVEGPEAAADAIGRCLASASSGQVRAYQASAARPPMAVLVQRLVDADAAGVAFTANPVSGDAEVLVSAVKGLGDRLVSGQATPDEWVVGGHAVSCLRSAEGALDQDQVVEIAALAKRVEQVFGAPQDIEWAIAGGELFLLQARPITALPVAPDFEAPAEGFWLKDSAHYPTPRTPFGASVFLPAISAVGRPLAEDFGLLLDGMDQRSVGGEVYVRMIPLGGKDRSAPPPWAMWLAARLVPQLRRRARAAETAITSGRPERLLDSWEGEWRAAFATEIGELRSVDLATLSDDALLGHLDCLKDLLRRAEDLHFRLLVPYALAVYELGAICRELLGWDVIQALSLVTGTSEASSEPGRELRALAKRIAADPPAFRAIAGPGGDPLSRLRQSSPWAAEAFEEYLERYCHRTVSFDPGDPTLFERPEVVAGWLAQQAQDSGAAVDDIQVQHDALAQAQGGLAGRGEEDKARFERALAYARRAYGTRDDSVFWLDQPCAFLRYCAVEIGRRLAGRGVLARAGDAVFLEEPELRDALTSSDGDDLRALVTRRKAERAWVIAHPGPLSYGTDPGAPPDMSPLPPALRLVNAAMVQSGQLMSAPSRPQDAADELRGVPGSPGRYSGTVRVVRDETEFAKLRPGDVLVAPATSPPWSVLFLQAGAVVTDSGGVLSHTAVIAREYGIPAVLATGEATRRLSDGDQVSVDGSTGVVSIVGAASDNALGRIG